MVLAVGSVEDIEQVDGSGEDTKQDESPVVEKKQDVSPVGEIEADDRMLHSEAQMKQDKDRPLNKEVMTGKVNKGQGALMGPLSRLRPTFLRVLIPLVGIGIAVGFGYYTGVTLSSFEAGSVDLLSIIPSSSSPTFSLLRGNSRPMARACVRWINRHVDSLAVPHSSGFLSHPDLKFK